MELFQRLGDLVEERWRARHYDENAFPALAEQALLELPPSEHVDTYDPLTWVFTTRDLPRHQTSRAPCRPRGTAHGERDRCSEQRVCSSSVRVVSSTGRADGSGGGTAPRLQPLPLGRYVAGIDRGGFLARGSLSPGPFPLSRESSGCDRDRLPLQLRGSGGFAPPSLLRSSRLCV